MGNEEENFGGCLHRVMCSQPDIPLDGRLFEFKAGTGFNLGEKSLNRDGMNDVGLNFHPLIGGLIDPEPALHTRQHFCIAIGRMVSAEGCRLERIDLAPANSLLSLK